MKIEGDIGKKTSLLEFDILNKKKPLLHFTKSEPS
jgi:hypothetical protein